MAADEAAMGLDFDFQDRGILGAADGGEGAAAALAAALVAGDLVVLDDDGEVGVVTAARPWPATLLAAWPPGLGRLARWGRRRRGSGRGLGLAAKEVLRAEAQLGAELFDLLAEKGLAVAGTLGHGLPVGGLRPGLKCVGEARASRTRAVGDGGRGTGRDRRVGRQRQPWRVRADRATTVAKHADRCSPARSAEQCS